MSELRQELAELAADLREWLRAAASGGVEGLPGAPRSAMKAALGEPAHEAPGRPSPGRPPPGRADGERRAASAPALRGAPPVSAPERPPAVKPPAAATAPAPPRPPPEAAQLTLGTTSWAAFGAPPAPPSTSSAPPAEGEPLDASFGLDDAIGAWGFPGGGGPKIAPGGPESQAAQALVTARQRLGDCRRCRLCEGRERLVFGMGHPGADLVVVGEGPGAQEDRQGLPFVGPSGQMLDRMLKNVMGLDRREVYILNVVKCRPPNNRTPLPDEIAACRPFLDAQLAAIQPKLILAMGRPAAQTLLGTERGINALRGRFHRWGPEGVPVLPTFHPAYLLRKPEDKIKALEDLKAARVRYDELGGRR